MRLALAASLLALGAAGPAGAQPATFVLDPAHTFVHFEVMHFGTSTLRGRLGPVQGRVVLDPAAGRGEIGLRIPTASVDTGVRVLDAKLREAEFFATDTYPEAFFVARTVRFAGESPDEVRGEFTLRGTSIPLSLKAMRFACRQDAARQARICGGDFEAFVDRSDFGITFGLPLVGDRVRLVIQAEGVQQ